MASWIVHLRIAEKLIDKLDVDLDEKLYYIGNIAIDSGKASEDGFSFYPPKSVSHYTKTGRMSDVDYLGFYEEYCRGKNMSEYSFYLGCFHHLYTDFLWDKLIYSGLIEKYANQVKKDKKFVYNFKQDWYDQDYVFIKKHTDFIGLKTLKEINYFENIYLPWFEKDAINIKIKEIVEFYSIFPENLKRAYLYTNEEKMNKFVDDACEILYNSTLKLLEK